MVLRAIPYGETRTYGELAAAIDSPNASRAVGMANHRNPIPIIIPCHRVIGANGTPGATVAVGNPAQAIKYLDASRFYDEA